MVFRPRTKSKTCSVPSHHQPENISPPCPVYCENRLTTNISILLCYLKCPPRGRTNLSIRFVALIIASVPMSEVCPWIGGSRLIIITCQSRCILYRRGNFVPIKGARKMQIVFILEENSPDLCNNGTAQINQMVSLGVT